MIAWERALAQVTGGAAFPAVRPDGLTDHQIAAWLLEAVSGTASDAGALVAAYEAELTPALLLKQGRVLTNVQPVLEWLANERPDVICWLVTGNTRPGGTAKLRHYALADYFLSTPGAATLEGAFSERVEPRANIVRRALEQAQAIVPGLAAAEALVIGDTPHDIEGARAIDVPVVAVATNTHSFQELQSHKPWRTLAELPGVAEFEGLLGATD